MSNSKPKTRNKTKRIFLAQLHIYTTLIAQIIASSILIAFILWLFIRLPEPLVHVTGFAVDTLDQSNTSNKTLLHYNITLHNPDLYKSINYDVLVLRITYSGYHSSSYGATIKFHVDNKWVHQSPRETTLLANHTVNYTDPSVGWDPPDRLLDLKTFKTFINLRFVMVFRVMAFNRVVLGKRQRMRTARVYFDDYGRAFIDSRHGLLLK